MCDHSPDNIYYLVLTYGLFPESDLLLSVAISAIPWAIMGQIKSYEDECNVDTTTYDKAYIFSLEIIMTIGFGAK